MTEKNESNRRRKWAPKARTGCRTCKTRHVKCDEQRPVCRRCVLSGFRCDGYPAIPTKREKGSPPSDDNSPSASSTESRVALSVITTYDDHSNTSPSESSSEAMTPLILTPTEPYAKSERDYLSFFISMTSSMVARSRVAPYFWKKLVPQAAWTYPAVRHALLATSISSQALVREFTDGEMKIAELQVLSHSSKAVQSLLTEKVPLDVVLLTSATLGVLDLFNGNWDTACTHVTHGAKLAHLARQDPKNEPFISFYCEAFASALPLVLKNAQNGGSGPTLERNGLVRLSEAISSLKLANDSFNKTLPKLQFYQGPDRDRIITMINNAKAETNWILPRWEELYLEEQQAISPMNDEERVNIHQIESPFSAVMANLNEHLDHGGSFDSAKFEVGMERTMPFYTCAKAGPHLKMRQTAVKLMRIGEGLRGVRGALPTNSPILTGTIIEFPGDKT